MTQYLDDTNTMRYCRHILLPNVQEDGQEMLLQSHALVVGAGGLGCAVLPYLAAAGVGTLSLFDQDKVDVTNLQRQILHTEQNLGMNKVRSATKSLELINSAVTIHAYEEHFCEAHSSLLKEANVVIDCSDNIETRLLLNRLCWQYRVPLISGSAIRMEGQLIHFPMRETDPCYGCVAALFEEPSLSCMEAGILSPVVGTIGTLQATEALKSLLQLTPEQVSLLLYDANSLQFRSFAIPKQPNCPTCSVYKQKD